MNTLSTDAVRGLMIAAQGLQDTPQPPAEKEDVLTAIRRMHTLQIDSINVVARAPYFVLWSRLGHYEPRWLDELLEEGALFEYWAHAMCFIPIEDYPLYQAASRWRDDHLKPDAWIAAHPEVVERVLRRVRQEGGARAADFERPEDLKTDWETRKDEKNALDQLLNAGVLMIRKRHNFQRIYDLRERVFPGAARLERVSRDEALDQFVLNTIQALGVVKAEWISNYYRLKHADAKAALKRLDKHERVIRVRVEGWDAPGYVHPAHLDRAEAADGGRIPQSKTTLLSPFDPLTRDAERMRDLWGFDYTIEFYFPADKRKYGYYSLPILYRNALVGRLDPKAHRKDGIFEVKSLHLEPDVTVDDDFVDELRRTLRGCALWHETPQVVVREATEPDLTDLLSD